MQTSEDKQVSWPHILSGMFIAAALFLVVATGYLVVSFGPRAYFLAFHRPLNIASVVRPPAYAAVPLPKFTVRSSINATQVSPGDTETVTVSVLPASSATGYLEVWVMSPKNKEIFKSPIAQGHPLQFTAGKAAVNTYSVPISDKLPKGKYQVSDKIMSSNGQTDYSLSENFATFELE